MSLIVPSVPAGWPADLVKTVKNSHDKLSTAVENLKDCYMGATPPLVVYSLMRWADTTTMLLKIRNTTNTAWLTVGTLDAAYMGLMALVSDQTVAGVKTFSSFPVTPSSAPTTDYQVANKKYADDTAGLKKIAEVAFSAESTKTISSALAANKVYKVTIRLALNTTAGILKAKFNNDASTAYRGNNFNWVSSSFGIDPYSVYSGMVLSHTTNLIGIGKAFFGSMLFFGDSSYAVRCNGDAQYISSASLDSEVVIRGYYAGAAALNRLDIYSSAGTLTGTVILYEMI